MARGHGKAQMSVRRDNPPPPVEERFVLFEHAGFDELHMLQMLLQMITFWRWPEGQIEDVAERMRRERRGVFLLHGLRIPPCTSKR